MALVRKERWRNEETWEEEKMERRGMNWKTKERAGAAAGEEGGFAMSSRPVQSHVLPDPESEQATPYTYLWCRQTE